MRMMPLVMVTFAMVACLMAAAVLFKLDRDEGAEGPFRARENCAAKCTTEARR